jgi:ribosome-associated translation inhibitor RaiA
MSTTSSRRRGRRKKLATITHSMPEPARSAVLDTLRGLGFDVAVDYEEEEDEERGVVERFEQVKAYKRLPELDATLSVTCYHSGECYVEASRFNLHAREHARAENLREAVLGVIERLKRYANRLTELSEALRRLERIGFERFGGAWDRVEMYKELKLRGFSYARVLVDPEHGLFQLQVEVPAEKVEKLIALVERVVPEIERELV